MSGLSRRVLLGTASLAAGAAGVGAAAGAVSANEQGYAGRKESSEELPTFRFAMEKNRGHVTDGGSARQATIKELPVSKGLAGVSMRLNPGGIRELHWHAIAAEWAFVIKGRVRTSGRLTCRQAPQKTGLRCVQGRPRRVKDTCDHVERAEWSGSDRS
jgi:oxalate decarboxylase